MQIKRWLILVVMLLCSGSLAVQAADLQDMQGNPHALTEYTGKGKWLIVMFWAADCLICNKEAKHYERFHQQHKDKDATLLGISMDGLDQRAQAQQFIREHKLTFPNLIGEAQQVASVYIDNTGQNWVGTPTFLLFNPEGQLKAEEAGAVPVKVIEAFIQAKPK
jgi:peroxiredoxin